MSKDLGKSTSYAYYVAEGGTKTPQEYGEMLVNIDTVATRAEDAADAAAESATGALNSQNAAQTAATTATNKASEATTAAQTATTKAGEASQSASQASASAQTASTKASEASASASTASTKATEATTAAGTATTAKNDAVSAKTAAETAQAAAETAQEAAEDAAESVSASAAQIATNTADISDVKENLSNIFSVTWETGKYINGNGQETSNGNFKCTDYIELGDVLFGIKYSLFQQSNTNIVSYYDADKVYINGVKGTDNNIAKTGEVSYPSNAKYVRFSHCIASAGVTNPAPVIKLKNIALDTKLARNAVTTPNITNNAVTKEKCAFIVHDPESNYIDKTKYASGYINGLGNFISNASWTATDYCELAPNTQYYSSKLHGGYCAFYRADKTVIASYGANSFTTSAFITPAETVYGRFSINGSISSVNANDAWIYTANEKPKDYAYIFNGVGVYTNDDSNPCDYIGNEISVFNKILCVGDSMTEGTFNHLDSGSTQYINISKYSYPKYLEKLTGVETTNLGHGGQTSVQWYNTEQNNDLSGYDCAIIQLGINDHGTYGSLGSDTKTAFQNIISKLKTQNKNIKIFVANIIPATSYSSDEYKQFSSDLLDWLESTYASDKDVIPLDIQQYGHTGDSSAYNCGHLSALGYRRLAEDYKNYISWYINKNKDVFHEVQFIGTDYWYANPNT